MEEINLKAELQEEKKNLNRTLSIIRRDPVFIDEEVSYLINEIKRIDLLLEVLEE